MRARGVAARGVAVLAVVAAGLAVTTTDASAEHSVLERISTGPSGGNGANFANFEDATPDGRQVAFRSDESLVAEDTDGGDDDLYVRSGGTTRLATVGLPDPPQGDFGPSFRFMSADASRIFFETDESLAPGDTDIRVDGYLSFLGQNILVTPGSADTDEFDDAELEGISTDGTRAVFMVRESLSGNDQDTARDLYLWQDGTITLLTVGSAGGNGPGDSSFLGMSADGTVVDFVTNGQLVPGDQDSTADVYQYAAGQVTLLSVGPSGGNDAVDVLHWATSTDGSRTLLSTTESLVPADVDTTEDLYLAHDGTVELVSPGTANIDAEFSQANASVRTVVFRTTESLLPADADSSADLYAWRDGALSLVTTAPGDLDGFLLEAGFVSDDGATIIVVSVSPLTADDTDVSPDLYAQRDGRLRLLSGGSEDEFVSFQGASRDASRVFFTSEEQLTADDTDTRRDVYESSAAGITKISPGNGPIDARALRPNATGSTYFLDTFESLLSADTDSQRDIYAARLAAPSNTTPPTVTGTPAAGRTLTCNPGTWQHAKTFSYRWNRDGTAIPGATSPTYVVAAGDAGHALSCTVTATGDGGSTSVTSAAVTVTNPGTGPLPGPCANAVVGTAGPDVLHGTVNGDDLFGLAGGDRLYGSDESDCLTGGPGRDRLKGGTGGDFLRGGKAADRLQGALGRDALRGEAGGDVLKGGPGRDRLLAGSGNDTVKSRDERVDKVRCGAGQDTAYVDQADDVAGCEVVVRK